MIKLSAAVLTGLAFVSTAMAAEGIRPVFGMAVTGGGEKLATVVYTNGTTQTVKSGGLLHLFGGVEYEAASYAIQANVGYHVDDTNATNGSVKFARMPVELLAFWKATDAWRFGGGVRRHFLRPTRPRRSTPRRRRRICLATAPGWGQLLHDYGRCQGNGRGDCEKVRHHGRGLE